MNNFQSSDLLPYCLITPNCPDGYRFGSLEQLCIFLSGKYLNIRVKVDIQHPI